jgi:hypothetical protein
MPLELRPISKIDPDLWDSFCKESNDAWFQHTVTWLEYTLNMKWDNNSINHSFGVFENGKLAAIVPLIEEKLNETEYQVFSMSGFPIPFPAFSNELSPRNRKKIESIIFKRILESADIQYINMYVSPLCRNSLSGNFRVNPLPRHNFHDTTISTNIISLHHELPILKKQLRKGHRSDIKSAKKGDVSVLILDRINFSENDFGAYQETHLQAAGRSTRPQKTWDIMAEWVKRGLAVLAIAKVDGHCVAVALVNTFNGGAYYQSGAALTDAAQPQGIGHLMQWEIITYLKTAGFNYYELGWNWFGNISQEIADKKMLQISRFKAGFGGSEYPLLRGEYFFNYTYMQAVLEERFEHYKTVNEM